MNTVDEIRAIASELGAGLGSNKSAAEEAATEAKRPYSKVVREAIGSKARAAGSKVRAAGGKAVAAVKEHKGALGVGVGLGVLDKVLGRSHSKTKALKKLLRGNKRLSAATLATLAAGGGAAAYAAHRNKEASYDDYDLLEAYNLGVEDVYEDLAKEADFDDVDDEVEDVEEFDASEKEAAVRQVVERGARSAGRAVVDHVRKPSAVERIKRRLRGLSKSEKRLIAAGAGTGAVAGGAVAYHRNSKEASYNELDVLNAYEMGLEDAAKQASYEDYVDYEDVDAEKVAAYIDELCDEGMGKLAEAQELLEYLEAHLQDEDE